MHLLPKVTAIIALTWAASTTSLLARGNAAPSSHFVFDDNFEGDIIIHDVRVPKNGEAMYTYYETLGWRGKAAGYAGIQAHPKAHNYIFSIWDHKSHTAPIKAVHRGPGTLTEKFGGEGTGLKSWNFELGWDTDVWYTLASRCWAVGDHTHYGYWVLSSKTKEWTHMVTMDVATKDAFFQGGTDAFIEDWLETGKNARISHLRNGWKRKRADSTWHAFGSGRYSVNSWDLDPGKRSFNYKTNWNGGVGKDDTGEFYFMTAGGKETKATVKNPSKHSIERDKKERPEFAPTRIQSAKLDTSKEGKLLLSWENKPDTLPQFSFTITAYARKSGNGKEAIKGKELLRVEKLEAHTRSTELALPKGVASENILVEIQCRDILDNVSPVFPVRQQ